MEKIIVIGCPGSGKSTFSAALNKITGIPLIHLDMLYWNKDKTTVEKAVFMERLSKVLQTPSFIMIVVCRNAGKRFDKPLFKWLVQN